MFLPDILVNFSGLFFGVYILWKCLTPKSLCRLKIIYLKISIYFKYL